MTSLSFCLEYKKMIEAPALYHMKWRENSGGEPVLKDQKVRVQGHRTKVAILSCLIQGS
jgi:hypothetical protein